MWWLERSDLLKRGQSSAHELGAYPERAKQWLKDRLHDREVRRSYRKPLDFTLKPILRPDTKPLRPDLRIPIEEIKPYESDDEIDRFTVPSSWRERLKEGYPGGNKNYRVEKEEVIVVEEKELTPAEKDQILLEQEGFVAKKRLRWRDILASLESKRPETQGNEPEWIKRALVTKPPGRAEGLRAPVSAIGARLNKKSSSLQLPHEQVSNSDGKPITGILLRQAHTDSPTPAELDLCKPISTFLRVEVPEEYGAARRIRPEDQETAIEKGGHGAFKDAIADKKVLLESLKRANDTELLHQEAAAHLCLGVLYDNGQDYTRAIENYETFLELCRKTGDVKGEAMVCNFIGCSLQEEQDKKLKSEKIQVGPLGEIELSTTATIQYEKAIEYHDKHGQLGDLEGKYIACTNVGLLESALGRWADAARSHRKALKCATLMRRPEYQGVAVGNLAYLLLRRRKFGASRLCTKRYLQICQALGYANGEAQGHYMLGHICAQQHKLPEAAEEFRSCLKIAKVTKNKELETSAKVLIGVVKGGMEEARLKAPQYYPAF